MSIQLAISQIILESVDFRHTESPLTSEMQLVPRTETSLQIEVIEGEDNRAAVRLKIDCEAPDSPYQYHASYLVVFSYEGDPPKDLGKRLAVTGANMALPFVRELIANLSSRGKFGTTWVAPTDFNAVVATGGLEAAKLLLAD